jgi:tripartite-type tricarboxylate transporter receptor subunit TctC
VRAWCRLCALLSALGLAGVAFGHAAPAGETWPNRPVRWIVPFTPGAGTDTTARLVAQRLSERLGQQFVVENKPGAGTNLGTETAINAPADGYTLLLVSPANAINATLYRKLPFDFARDMVPVAAIMSVPNVMDVTPSLPVNTVAEFIAYAKAHPGKINMASAGTGTSVHLSGELFKAMAGVDIVHVPYRGSNPALTDLMAGQVDLIFNNMPSSISLVASGKIRALAVTTAARSHLWPDVPTVGETVPGYAAFAWYGIGAPKGTPPEVVATLNRAVNEVLADPQLGARLTELGGTLLPGSPDDFGRLIAGETDKWGKLITSLGLKVE